MDKKEDDCMVTDLLFYVNGRKVIEPCPDPDESLLHYMRRALFLTGTKESCGEGACGSCTVMISSYNHRLKRVEHTSQSACLTPVVAVHGKEVTTTEGLGNTDTGLHPVQEQLAESHGTQCGFCSPGFVMSMYSLLQNQPEPSRQQMEGALSGNICRCTGYRPILEGMATFCQNSSGVPDIEDAGKQPCLGKYDRSRDADASRAMVARVQEFVDSRKLPAKFAGPNSTWYQPTSLDDLVKLKTSMPDARVISGASTMGFLPKKPTGNIYISTGDIPELKELEIRTEYSQMKYLHVGAAVTITELKEFIKEKTKDDGSDAILKALLDTVNHFDAPSVANIATLGGNVAGASPTSDINVFLLAAAGEVRTRGHEAVRASVVNQQFFPGFRKTGLKAGEVLTSLRIPLDRKNTYAESYKEDRDSVVVNSVFTVTFEDNSNVVKEGKLSFGGIGPTPLLATKVQEYMVGKSWTSELCTKACTTLREELGVPEGSPGGAEHYRNCLVTSLFFRFFTRVASSLKEKGVGDCSGLDVSSLPTEYSDVSREGVQVFQDPAPENPSDMVGAPLSNISGQTHASGQSVYVDDMPPMRNELDLVLLLSPKPRAKIISLDSSAALSMPGVKAVISADDIGDANFTRAKTQPVFAKEEVQYEGQPIVAVVAETREQAKKAVGAIEVKYEDLGHITTTREAMKAHSFHGEPFVFPPNATDPLVGAKNVLEGEFEMGGQRHVYMETQRAIAVPKGEKGELDLHTATQAPALLQGLVSRALKVDKNKVAVKVKRCGGAFGGKITDTLLIGLPAVLAATQLKRPIRGVLDRREDMLAIGGRHPFVAKYKVGYSDDGKIEAVDIDFYFNGGFHQGQGTAEDLMYMLTLCVSGYAIPRGRIVLHLCKTNTHASNAFRAVVVPGGMIVFEHCIHDVAAALNLPIHQVQKVNFARQGDSPFNGERIKEPTVQQCFEEIIKLSDFHTVQEKVLDFNRENRWKKRGVSVIPTGYSICTGKMHAQALVHIYTDSSVLVGYTGTEMGQGLHTKMVQIVTRVLGVPLHKVHIKETNTDVSAEGVLTAGSTGTQMSGMAVKNACEKLAAKLEPFRKSSPEGSWESWVNDAYANEVELSETGVYWLLQKEPTFPGGFTHNHTTYGAVCALVELDCLTGNTEVLSTDIMMDVGKSLSPMVDIGQIEGGFLQGYGLYMMEDERYRPDGKLITTGLGTYKVPRIRNIPQKFNVHLLKGRDTPNAVYSAKGIGEPPVFLASSVYFATRMAVAAARKDAGLDEKFTFNTPASPERIRLACGDQFSKP